MKQRPKLNVLGLVLCALVMPTAGAADREFELQPGDHVAIIGNTLADRLQHDGWFDTYLHALYPDHDLTIRNLGFPGDEVQLRLRSDNFGSPDEWLTKVNADVVFCFFGYNEALRGEAGLDQFRTELTQMIEGMRKQKYNGETAPRIVVFSPIGHEDLQSPHLPDGAENNEKLALYTTTMQYVCEQLGVTFVNLYEPTLARYEADEEPLTLNGVHLLPEGNRALAEIVLETLFGADPGQFDDESLEKLREAVMERNLYWFSRYRVVDGYNVYGGRSKLAWFGQSNADVMMREMEIFDVMTANRDRRVWAIAKGGDLKVRDDNIPEELQVQTNKPGPLPDQGFPYLQADEAIMQMEVHDGMQVNTFASEEMFPRLINPVQMAVDPDSRLWVSVWPSYPHWKPTEPRRDALLILPDDNGDGVADDCIVFADELNSITGFEFWGGGVLVAAPPEIWFLQDTDGDDKADVKRRMLQGVSSADTHHSANAMLIGPDGWLYWSRGIFNVALMETPTKTYRSKQSGVHRFNPRTFEIEFHFPIGPNPHGDVFDQWGYQFASDGTSGTGSYINIGKGVKNKQWYQKRVRPVPSIGILSSSHFPEEVQGNFLISNAIGVLGVLQHEVKYNGADITAEEIDPIVVSSDPNFRPSDLEIGGDGALYISDWHNALIGHMQHNMRDPNRDATHGRVYRVTAKGRDLLEPVKMRGKPIAEVCDQFYAKENGTRYRARLELSGRETSDVVREVSAWADARDVSKPADAQSLLECLWVFEEHRVPNGSLLATVFEAEEPRVRAAAIRTLGHWGSAIESASELLLAAATDASALVRAEAVKASVEFPESMAAEVYFEVARRPLDPELEAVLTYARGQVDVNRLVRDAIQQGRSLSDAGRDYALANSSAEDLLKMEESAAVYEAILSRDDVPVEPLRTAWRGLADLKKTSEVDLLLELIEARALETSEAELKPLEELLLGLPAEALQPVKGRIRDLATTAGRPEARQLGYAAWIVADQSGENAFFAASQNKSSLRDLVASVPSFKDPELRSALYSVVRDLMFELPPNLKAEASGSMLEAAGIRVDFFHPSASNVARETLEEMTPKASGVVPEIVMNVPQKSEKDKFALRFTGYVNVPKSGMYTFYSRSDDGSRIYVDGKLVVNHDGLHGMSEKSGKIKLSAGRHALLVTYFDNGGGDGLQVTWSGPGLKKQPIAADRLSVDGNESLHDVAVKSMASIPGHDEEKFRDLARLVKAGRSRAAAVRVLRTIPAEHRPNVVVRPLLDNLIGYLSSFPASRRNGPAASEAMALARELVTAIPKAERAGALSALENLDVRVIAIGTVPARMIFDKEQIVVQAGQPVEFRFSNSDHMPHNFAIVRPGTLETVGELAEETGRDADAKERHYIPKTDDVLLASRLLEPGQKQSLTYEVPAEPGVYPYVCTYPGHWRRMYGALYVVEDLEAYQANPDGYLAANPLPLKDDLLKYASRNTEWKFEDLAEALSTRMTGRSHEVGQSLFKVANCVACHKLGEEGRQLGPDLAKIEPKKHTFEHLLRSMLEPSKEIDEKFQSNVIVLESGKIVTGLVLKETPDEIQVLIDPLAKADPLVIPTATIEERVKSPVSIMPAGLLNKLTEAEILDLLAFVYAGGDPKHALYKGHHHHH